MCYGILEGGGDLILSFACVGSVDIVGFGEGICGNLVDLDDAGNSVSDLSDGSKDVSVDSSGSCDVLGSRILSRFYLEEIESTLYILKSSNPVGIAGIS